MGRLTERKFSRSSTFLQISFLLGLILSVTGCTRKSLYISETEDGALTLRRGERLLAGFQCVARVPDTVDPVYARAGYLHPIYTPSGTVVTGDYAISHRHQHGVFFAWTKTRFEGREVDFWNTAKRQGVVRLSDFEALDANERWAGFDAVLVHIDSTSLPNPRIALHENWRVRVQARTDATIIDLDSQQAAVHSPLEILQYHYGGFAARGPETWEGVDGALAITNNGANRVEGNQSNARWVALSGGNGSGTYATIAVLASPKNPRAPEPVRIHPSNPYFCFTACQQGTFTITPGAPRLTRYRIVAMDGRPNVKRIEELWQEFADQ